MVTPRLLAPVRAAVGALCSAAWLCGLPACDRAPTRPAFVLPDVVDVRMTGADYRWRILYAGPDGRLGTADDRRGEGDLHLPVGHRAHIALESEDYIYTLDLPAYDQKQIAVPDMAFAVTIEASEVGRSRLDGDEMCGIDHPHLRKTVIVHPRDEYERVIAALPLATDDRTP